jgi:hypothetical protein
MVLIRRQRLNHLQSSDDDVKEKTNSSSSCEMSVSGSRGVGGGDGVETPSSLFIALRVSLVVIESA